MKIKKYITPSCTCYEVTNKSALCELSVGLGTQSNLDGDDSEKVKGEYSDNFLWNDTKH